MEKITIKQLVQATGAELKGSTEGSVEEIVRDSREVRQGSLFVAIAGEKVDGHRFIASAWERGAKAVLSQQSVSVPEGCSLLVVPDTLKALGQIAAYYRSLFSVPVVAVTGSVGKTSCKDMVAAALSGGLRTVKTEANFNNHIGVPLTLFGLDHETQAAVIEMGMNHFGEIDYVAQMAKPDYGIITNIGISHVENLGSQEGILQAKLELLPHIEGEGPVFLNGDDPLLYGLKGKLDKKVEYFGYQEHNQARVLSVELTEKAHLKLELSYQGERYDFVLRTMGRHMAYNALPAIMAAVHIGLSKEEILRGLAGYIPTPHRLEAIDSSQYLLIDDTYNASPASMCSALEAMDSIPSKRRRVAILGDMFELGDYAEEGHKEVGRYVADQSKAEVLICCGEAAGWIYEAAQRRKGLKCHYFKNVPEMEKNLFTILKKDDIILLKASHGMGFTAVCEKLLQYKES